VPNGATQKLRKSANRKKKKKRAGSQKSRAPSSLSFLERASAPPSPLMRGIKKEDTVAVPRSERNGVTPAERAQKMRANAFASSFPSAPRSRPSFAPQQRLSLAFGFPSSSSLTFSHLFQLSLARSSLPFPFLSFFPFSTLAHLNALNQTMTQNQMILQRLRGRDVNNADGSKSNKRAASPSTPTSMLDEDLATPTTSNSSSAASTCDVVLTRSGLAAAKQQQQQLPNKVAGAAATAAAAAATANANSVEAVRPPVLCHRKSVAISFRGRDVPHTQMPPLIADACPNTPSEEALAIVTLAMFFG